MLCRNTLLFYSINSEASRIRVRNRACEAWYKMVRNIRGIMGIEG